MSIYSDNTVSEIYKKLEHRKHVLQLPDTYRGSVDEHTDCMYIYNYDGVAKKNTIVKKSINWIPGLLNILQKF